MSVMCICLTFVVVVYIVTITADRSDKTGLREESATYSVFEGDGLIIYVCVSRDIDRQTERGERVNSRDEWTAI